MNVNETKHFAVEVNAKTLKVDFIVFVEKVSFMQKIESLNFNLVI